MKKIIISLSLLLTLIVGIIGFMLFNNKSKTEKMSKNNIVLKSSSKINDSSSSTNKSSSSSSQSDTNLNNNDNSKIQDNTQKNEDKTIDDNINSIKKLVIGLNQFKNASNNYYNDLVNQFNSYNITLDDSVKGPFGIFDVMIDGTDQSTVLSGIVKESTVENQDNSYVFTNKALVGQGAVNGSLSDTGTIIQEALESGNYDNNIKTVQYRLTLSEDKKSGTLSLISGQWW